MTHSDGGEAIRLAQAAAKKSESAGITATEAVHRIETHEEVCTLRYEQIEKNIAEIKENQKTNAHRYELSLEKVFLAIGEINNRHAKAQGIDMAARWIIMVLGAAGVVFGIYEKLRF